MNRRWLEIGSICALVCVSLVTRAEAAGPIDVTALPAPCTSVSAIPNDWYPDSPGIFCAITNLLPATGGELYFPAGNYYIAGQLRIENKSVTIRGAGQKITRLTWFAGTNTNGIEFVSNSGPTNHTLVVKSLSLFRGVSGDSHGGAAIYGEWQTPTFQGSRGGVSATISDVHIGIDPFNEVPGTGVDGNYWDYGIQLRNAVGARINAFHIYGSQNFGTRANLTPIHEIAAIQIGGKSIGVSINDGDMGQMLNGIYVAHESEAVQVENVEGGDHGYAFRFETTGKGHVLSHCHASSVSLRFAYVVDSSEVAITDNLYYNSENPNVTAIEIVNNNPAYPGSGFRVRGNQIAEPCPLCEGIVLSGNISDSVVSGNQTDGALAHGIWLKAGVTASVVVGNRVGTITVVDLSSNLIADNPM